MRDVGPAMSVHVGKHAGQVGILDIAFHAGDAIVTAQRNAGDAVAASVSPKPILGPGMPIMNPVTRTPKARAAMKWPSSSRA